MAISQKTCGADLSHLLEETFEPNGIYTIARTIEAIRKEIQNSKEGVMSLAKKYGINHKTVIKWTRFCP